MKQAVLGFLLAVQFLSRLPVPVSCPWNKATSRWALRNYPVVGIIIGLIIAGVMHILYPYLPLAMLALLIVSLWVWLTGGLHLDGWMDAADAVGSNAPLEKKWKIMKDPHAGSFAVISLFFLLAWKTVFVYFLLGISVEAASALLLITAFSRLTAVLLLLYIPSAKKEGLAWEWKKNLTSIDAGIAAVPVIGCFIFFPNLLLLIPAYAVFFFLYGFWIKRTFKGVNGDLAGASIEGGELWGLAVLWIYFSFVTG